MFCCVCKIHKTINTNSIARIHWFDSFLIAHMPCHPLLWFALINKDFLNLDSTILMWFMIFNGHQGINSLMAFWHSFVCVQKKKKSKQYMNQIPSQLIKDAYTIPQLRRNEKVTKRNFHKYVRLQQQQ